jgi:hypothetical protein
LEKKKEKNKKLKAKVKLDRSFLACTQDTIEGVSDLGLIVVLLRGVKLISNVIIKVSLDALTHFICIRI